MEGDSALDKKIKRHIAQIVCVLCAIALWLYVNYTEDPEMQIWVRNIPVSYIGYTALEEQGLALVESDGPADINVKIAGRRSVLYRLQNTDIRAYVDYATIGKTGQHTLPVSVTVSPNNTRVTKLSVSAINCRTDVLVTVDKTVGITTSGAEQLGIHDLTAYPSTIRVTGPESVLAHLTASVHINLLAENVSDTYTITLADRTGKAFPQEAVTVGADTVTISATRSLPVDIEAANCPEHLTVKEVVCSPETVDIRGTLSALLSVDSAPGSYDAWMDFSHSPASSGQIPLIYPQNVEVLGPAFASAQFHFE